MIVGNWELGMGHGHGELVIRYWLLSRKNNK